MKRVLFGLLLSMLVITIHADAHEAHEHVQETTPLTTHHVDSKHVVIPLGTSLNSAHTVPALAPDEPILSARLNPSTVPVAAPAHFTCKADGSLCHVFFSPHDGLREKLIQLIEAEQESIHIAVFTFTEKEIAQALLRAHARGVRLTIIVDPICVRDRYNKIGMLCDHAICTRVYNPQHAKPGMPSCMHHKFAIFKKNIGNKPLLWTGSFNFTRSAALSNHENALVLNNSDIIAQFERQFEIIQSQSYRYKIDKKNHANA